MEYAINTFLSGTVLVTSDCIRHKSKRATCRQCIDYCEHHALSLTENETVAVKAEACTRCGGCVFACPVMAIEGPMPQRRAEDERLYQDGESIPSLKELLLYYHEGYCTLILDESHPLWMNIVEEANTFLHSINKPPFSIISPSLNNNDSYFKREDSAIKRRRLLGIGLIQRYLKQDELPKNISLAEVFKPYQQFSIDVSTERCSLCGSCLQLCPAGVFHYQDRQFSVDTGKCVGCRLCEESCPEEALSVRPDVKESAVSSYAFHAALCPRCQRRYPSLSPDEHLCPACVVRERLRFSTQRIGMNSLNFPQ
ncbi:4Fe-4S binding protein [Leminorella grimontii]|uniref:4Fe-4S binding protein n=1 Tax=Leminorella grimontii TaxID=82981 RepID=UPI00208D7773|nr:4Fe-4S binding protein [Leminorella grimontii]GKX59797.1 hypothetical protein SOASR031_21120 [Leminorella grimontii]